VSCCIIATWDFFLGLCFVPHQLPQPAIPAWDPCFVPVLLLPSGIPAFCLFYWRFRGLCLYLFSLLFANSIDAIWDLLCTLYIASIRDHTRVRSIVATWAHCWCKVLMVLMVLHCKKIHLKSIYLRLIVFMKLHWGIIMQIRTKKSIGMCIWLIKLLGCAFRSMLPGPYVYAFFLLEDSQVKVTFVHIFISFCICSCVTKIHSSPPPSTSLVLLKMTSRALCLQK
jgi:hypothetical protein